MYKINKKLKKTSPQGLETTDDAGRCWRNAKNKKQQLI
jgi:hypothetical protein